MNIAFGTIIILVLLMPAYFFRTALYHSSSYQKADAKKTVMEQFVLLSLLSLGAHLVILSILRLALPLRYYFCFETVTRMITGSEEIRTDKLLNEFEGHWRAFRMFVGYNVLVNLLALLVGWGLRIWINFKNVKNIAKGINKRVYSLYNEWYYMLAVDHRTYEKNWLVRLKKITINNATNFVLLDVLVQGKHDDIIYSGILRDFKSDGEKLERLVLANARKRPYVNHGEKEDVFQPKGKPIPIAGNIFVIPADKILNINIEYYSMD